MNHRSQSKIFMRRLVCMGLQIMAASIARAADPAHWRITSSDGGWNAEPFVDPLVVNGAGRVTVTETPVFVIVDPQP